MEWREADRVVGGLSRPSKMPGWAYGIPPQACSVGSILAKRSGSVCSGCYALKGRYVMPNVRAAQERRLASLRDPRWVEAMVALLRFKYRRKRGKNRVFRWHDAGDLQGLWHLERIVAVVRALPTIRFWLPTREYGLVRAWQREHSAFPANLVVRVSAPKLTGDAPAWAEHASSVSAERGHLCPVNREPGRRECGPCRACWDPSVPRVDYAKH